MSDPNYIFILNWIAVKFRLFFLLFFFLLLTSTEILAQTFIGLFAELGNQVNISPQPSKDLLESPPSISGSIVLRRMEEISNCWYIQYGVGIGVLGYRLKVLDSFDTIGISSREPSYTKIADYGLPYINADLLFGKQFSLESNHIFLGAGAGITYYGESSLNTTFTIVDESGKPWLIFDYDMERKDENVKWFIELSVQMKIRGWALLGLGYRHHFTPAFHGSYNFYHMKDPPSGDLSLTQRAVTMLFMVRIGKDRYSNFPWKK